MLKNLALPYCIAAMSVWMLHWRNSHCSRGNMLKFPLALQNKQKHSPQPAALFWSCSPQG